jgi:hypothetical protein
LWLLSAYFQQKNKYEKKLLISIRNPKQKSAVKVVADGVYTAKIFKTKSLTSAKERATSTDAADV